MAKQQPVVKKTPQNDAEIDGGIKAGTSRLIVDFDGPMMDVSERYYRVYQFCLETIKKPQQPVHPLSKAQFWQCKQTQVPEVQIGLRSGLNQAQAQQFAQLRHQTVHNLPYLIYDRLIPNVRETLEKIRDWKIDLVVMTLRRQRELEIALNQYDLGQYFPADRRYCLRNNYQKTDDVKEKSRLMQQAWNELPIATETWMVGDTEADIAAAKLQNIPIITVLSGIRARQQLERYQPDFIVADFAAAVALITAKSRAAARPS